MRTTVTPDPDVTALLRRAMRERGLTFKQARGDAVRAGVARPQPPLPVYDMGEPLVDVTKALRLAGELEDRDRAAEAPTG